MGLALSVWSVDPEASIAQVIGEIEPANASWLARHLQELDGDVTLHCRDATFSELIALRVFADFEDHLARRGDHLVLDGFPRHRTSVAVRGDEVAAARARHRPGAVPRPGDQTTARAIGR